MLYMIVERFRDGDPVPVYARVRAKARQANDVRYVASWGTTDLARCYQVMECDDRAALQWVDWFNNRRLLEPIGCVPPAEFEKAFYEKEVALVRAA
ncbi:MAG: DUF3303 family protein [Deltaproteobacteria bacterium]|nr:DUF3303 family protein [Deltaproteobacteria bacterium]